MIVVILLCNLRKFQTEELNFWDVPKRPNLAVIICCCKCFIVGIWCWNKPLLLHHCCYMVLAFWVRSLVSHEIALECKLHSAFADNCLPTQLFMVPQININMKPLPTFPASKTFFSLWMLSAKMPSKLIQAHKRLLASWTASRNFLVVSSFQTRSSTRHDGGSRRYGLHCSSTSCKVHCIGSSRGGGVMGLAVHSHCLWVLESLIAGGVWALIRTPVLNQINWHISCKFV